MWACTGLCETLLSALSTLCPEVELLDPVGAPFLVFCGTATLCHIAAAPLAFAPTVHVAPSFLTPLPALVVFCVLDSAAPRV